MKQKRLYIELDIHTDMESLWEHTQNPQKHQEWDLRFSKIDYLPQSQPDAPQEFLYRKNIGFGLEVSGKGLNTGARNKINGERISSLRFWSDDPASLIEKGSGFWQYLPNGERVTYLTWYDYQTRYGAWGKFIDAIFFRPLMGWATAWSFDRLRLWLEKDIHPKISLHQFIQHLTIQITLASIWIYQGLFPKLIFPDAGVLDILSGTGLFPGLERVTLTVIGLAEILFGVCFILFRNSKILHQLNVLLVICFTLGAAYSNAGLLVQQVNSITLSLGMTGLSIAGILSTENLPSAQNCKRKP